MVKSGYGVGSTQTSYPFLNTTEYGPEWFIKYDDRDIALEDFYAPAIFYLLLGWIVYWIMTATMTFKVGNKSFSLQSAQQMISNLGSLRFSREAGEHDVAISKGMAALVISLLWGSLAVVVQILHGVQYVNTFSIISLWLAAALYRFIRFTSRNSYVNVGFMVPNLLLLISLFVIMMAYTNAGNHRTSTGKNFLYWISFGFTVAAGLIETVLSVTVPYLKPATKGAAIDAADEAAYVIPKWDYAIGIFSLTIFSVWELALIAEAGNKDYTIPFFVLELAIGIMLVRIIVAYVGDMCGAPALHMSGDLPGTRAAKPQSAVAFCWNFFIICMIMASTLFAHVNVCSSSPLDTDDLSWTCGAGMRRDKWRITAFSVFSQTTLFMIWIGYMRSCILSNNAAQNELIGFQHQPKKKDRV